MELTKNIAQPVYRVRIKVAQRLLAINKLLNVGNEFECTLNTDYRTGNKFWQVVAEPHIRFDTFATEILT